MKKLRTKRLSGKCKRTSSNFWPLYENAGRRERVNPMLCINVTKAKTFLRAQQFGRKLSRLQIEVMQVRLRTRMLQRSSCGLPVRADSLAASKISITCTLSRAETGSSMGLLLRMQSTKYEIGLLVSFGSAASVTFSPSAATFGPRASAERYCKVLWRASRLPFGPNTSTCSFVYGQSQEASMIAVASG